LYGSGGDGKFVISEIFYPLGAALSNVGAETSAKTMFPHDRWNGMLEKATATNS
jgi:hypothetical protein